MDDKLVKTKGLKNEGKIIVGTYETKSSELGDLFQKRKEMIIQFMENKRKRLEQILLKEKEIKIQRIYEDAQKQKKLIEEEINIQVQRMKEDLSISQQKEIAKLQEEEEFINLKKKMNINSDDAEGIARMISLNEELREKNEPNASDEENNGNKKKSYH